MKRLLLGLAIASAFSFGMQPSIQSAEAKSFGEIIDSAVNAVSPNRYGAYGYGGYGVSPYYVNYSNSYNPYYGGGAYYNPYAGSNTYYGNVYGGYPYGYNNYNYNYGTRSNWTDLLRYIF
jgi:hypothetical protein